MADDESPQLNNTWSKGLEDENIRPIPVVPHKVVAEVAKYRKPKGEIGCCESPMAEQKH